MPAIEEDGAARADDYGRREKGREEEMAMGAAETETETETAVRATEDDHGGNARTPGG